MTKLLQWPRCLQRSETRDQSCNAHSPPPSCLGLARGCVLSLYSSQNSLYLQHDINILTQVWNDEKAGFYWLIDFCYMYGSLYGSQYRQLYCFTDALSNHSSEFDSSGFCRILTLITLILYTQTTLIGTYLVHTHICNGVYLPYEVWLLPRLML